MKRAGWFHQDKLLPLNVPVQPLQPIGKLFWFFKKINPQRITYLDRSPKTPRTDDLVIRRHSTNHANDSPVATLKAKFMTISKFPNYKFIVVNIKPVVLRIRKSVK
jgi:hypothetical protein